MPDKKKVRKRLKRFSSMKGGSKKIVDRYMHMNVTKAFFDNMTDEERRRHMQNWLNMQAAQERAEE